MAESRRRFDQDFKEGAVRIVRETGKPVAQVARDLGVNKGTLGNWVNLDRRRRGEGNGALGEDERAELARLRRENAQLAMERDVLKRSVALWAPARWAGEPGGRDRGRGNSTASRRLSAAGRWASARPGSTSGAAVMSRRGGPAGRRWPRRSPGCSRHTRGSTDHRGPAGCGLGGEPEHGRRGDARAAPGGEAQEEAQGDDAAGEGPTVRQSASDLVSRDFGAQKINKKVVR